MTIIAGLVLVFAFIAGFLYRYLKEKKEANTRIEHHNNPPAKRDSAE